MLPPSIYSFFIAALVVLTSSSAIPASNPREPAATLPLNVDQVANGFTILPLTSTWDLPSAAPNASFEETEQEFRQLKGSKPPICDAGLYGRPLQLESCREAQRMIPTDRRLLNFGLRNRGRWDINLPYRISSSDGLCVIEIGPPMFGVSDQATGFDIAHAAWAIINTCVADYKSEGGRSDGVGFLKRLSVHVASYKPHVSCAPPRSPPAPQPSDCNMIIDQMATSKDLKDFAPAGTPHLDFVVPYQLISPLPERGCVVMIRLELFKDKTVTSSWYDIWAAAVAVNQMCVVQGRSGQALDVGWPANLLVQMVSGGRNPVAEVGGSTTT